MSAVEGAEGRVIGLADEGVALLAAERGAIFAGRFGEIGALVERKGRLLAHLEEAIPKSRGIAPVRTALARLIREGRRNEKLIAAAQRGLRGAQRRISSIRATRSGAVAYASDGSRIVSRADAEGGTRQA